MREFFLNLLNSLDKLTGMKQMDKLQASENSLQEINDLLDILCHTCEQFPMIPEEQQKLILRHAVVSDGDFIGLNAKFVYKSLYAQKDRFIVGTTNQGSDSNWKPLEGEQRAEWLNKWLRSLSGFDEKIGGKSHVQLLEESLPPKDKGVTYHAPKMTPEEFARQEMKRELHTQYIRENYETLTAKPLPTWVNEQEWLRKQLRLDNPEATEEQIQEFINNLK